VHPEFTLDDCGGKAAKDIESKVDLDLAVVKFDLPALRIELGDGLVGKLIVIEK